MSEELPPGWMRAPIGALCQLINGRAFKPTDWKPEGLPIIRIQNLNNEDAPFNRYPGPVEERHLVSDGELLFAWSGTPGTSFGAHVWTRGRAVLNQHIFRVLYRADVVDRDFFRMAINFVLDELIAKAHGGAGLAHITKGRFEETEVLVPPLAEQRRIVARIEALFARIRQARADLLRIAPLAEHLWRTRLIASVTGSDQIATDGGADIAQPANDPDLAGVWPVDGIPSSWSWLPFTAAFDDVTSSQNKLQQKAYLASGQFPVIDQGEAEIGGWSDDENLVYRGTLPVIVFGDHTRAVKYVERPFIQGADGVKLLAPRGSILHPRFAFWMLKALPLPDKGYARHMKFLRASFLPVPPLCEQKRIAESLDRSSLRSGVMTHEATRALALLNHLERSILTRAFRGELVPQDPADEPASVSLARSQEGAPAAPRRGRPRRAA